MTTKQDLDTWAAELNDITATATPEEREAMEAFQAAMTPYLEMPERLRTVMGKICAPAVGPEVAELMKTADFKTVGELQAVFGGDVTLVEA